MQVSYVGPHAAVEVPSLGIEAVRDEPIEVDDKDAAELLKQEGIWAKAAPSKTTKGDK